MGPGKDKHDDKEKARRLHAFVKAQPKETEKKLQKLLRERGLLPTDDGGNTNKGPPPEPEQAT